MIFDLRALPRSSAVRPAALPRGSRGRALCIGHVMPYPTRAGNEYRIHQLLSWLANEGWDLTVVVCPARVPSEQQMVDAAAVYPNLVVCAHDGVLWHHMADGGDSLEVLRGREPADIAALLNEHDHGDPARARVLGLQRGFCPDVLVDLVRHLDRTWRPDVLLAEYVFMTRPFPLLRRELLTIVDTIDVFSTKASKVEQHGVTDGYGMSEHEEGELLRRADVLIGIQPGESDILARLSPRSTVVSVGVDFPVVDRPQDSPPGAIALLVGMDNPMNVKGLQDFLRFAWPLIRRAVPDAELRVAGAVGDSMPEPPDGVRVLGRLDRLAPEYAAARVAINPAVAGTGLKIKTVEAICHLRPVVTWPAGIDGIGPESTPFCHVASDWSDFAGQVNRLLTDTTVLTEMARHRDTLRRVFSSESVYAPLRDVLDTGAGAAAEAAAGQAVGAVAHRATGANPLRILTVLARHGTGAYPTALADLRDLFARQMPDVVHDVLVVDNAPPEGRVHPQADVELIGGSNDAWEFSAWDEAIAHLGARLDGYDFIHLATSAFRQLYARYLDRFDTRMLALMRSRAAVIGHIDHYNEPVSLFRIASQAWVRSSFIVLPPQELRRLGSLVSVADRRAFFSGDSKAPFRDDAPLSETYRRNILGWLTGDGTGQGIEWHSRFRLDAHTLRTFEDKTLAILNEQMLTNRLRALGCDIVDATWLATQAAVLGERPMGTIPPWRDQLAARDTDPTPTPTPAPDPTPA